MKLLIILLTVFFVVITIVIYRKGRREAEEAFNYDYENLVKFIRKHPATEDNYYTIRCAIQRLRKMRNANREKIDVVECEMRRKYGVK